MSKTMLTLDQDFYRNNWGISAREKYSILGTLCHETCSFIWGVYVEFEKGVLHAAEFITYSKCSELTCFKIKNL